MVPGQADFTTQHIPLDMGKLFFFLYVANLPLSLFGSPQVELFCDSGVQCDSFEQIMVITDE